MLLLNVIGPWWLVRRGRDADASRVLQGLSRENRYQEGELDGYLEHMRFTIAMERESRARGSFADMFRKTNLRRTEIELGAWLLQNWNGRSIYGLAVVLWVHDQASTYLSVCNRQG